MADIVQYVTIRDDAVLLFICRSETGSFGLWQDTAERTASPDYGWALGQPVTDVTASPRRLTGGGAEFRLAAAAMKRAKKLGFVGASSWATPEFTPAVLGASRAATDHLGDTDSSSPSTDSSSPSTPTPQPPTQPPTSRWDDSDADFARRWRK